MRLELTVRLGSLELKNPVICASGEWGMTPEGLRAAVDAGAAAVVAKSTNESAAAKRQLQRAEYVLLDEEWRPLGAGRTNGRWATLFNRSGLVDEPFDRWVETLARADAYAADRGAYVVASLIPAELDELTEMAGTLEAAGLRWLELNLGASHGEEAARGAIELAQEVERIEEIVGRVRETVTLPLTVKLPGQGDVLGFVGAAREAGADSVCLVGRPLAFLPDLQSRRPLLGTFGAIGGRWALPLTLRWVAKARERLGPDFPLLATNGVRDGGDVARALLAGASATQLGTAVWTDGPSALTAAVDELGRYLEEQGATAQEIIGQAADAVMTYEEAGNKA